MDKQELEEIAFSIVGHVGTARSMSMEAIRLSRAGKFEDAEQLFERAHEELLSGQKDHFKIITQEAKSKDVAPTMLLIHAEDQMMAAEIIRDLAQELMETNRDLARLR